MGTGQPGTWTAKGHGATVTFDGESVTITRSLMSPGGRGESSFPLRQLTGVDLERPGAAGGRFTLIAAGGTVQRHSRRDPMSVTFTYPHRREFEELAAAIRAALTRGQANAQPAAPVQSLDAQLANLAQLHAAGALTDGEFAAAKARLLGAPQDTPGQAW